MLDLRRSRRTSDSRRNSGPGRFLRRFPEPPIFRYLQAKLLVADGAAEQALALARQLTNEHPLPQHAEVLALSLAAAGEWSEAEILQSDLVEMAQQMGAFDQTERLEQRLKLYRRHQLPDPIWPIYDPLFNVPPVDIGTPMKNYPAAHPY